MAFVLLAIYVSLHLAICCAGHPNVGTSAAPAPPVNHAAPTWHDHSRDLLPCEPHAHSGDDVLCTALPWAKSELAPLVDLAVALPVLGLVTAPSPSGTRRRHRRTSLHSGRSLLLAICVARN